MTNDNTRIEWTDATWNPTTGCSKVSAGCVNCYAEAVSHRWGWTTKPWTHPFAAENVKLHPERLTQPLRWQKPRRIFVDSMSDLFHEQVSGDYIAAVFAVMAAAPQHIFQVLTKRPERMAEFIGDPSFKENVEAAADCMVGEWGWRDLESLRTLNNVPAVLPNVWVGTSVEDQRAADERLPRLINTSSIVRFLSCEPLLGPVNLYQWLWEDAGPEWAGRNPSPWIDWVIVGGESGPNHRPFDPDWARDLRDQCVAAGVPFFFKQHGGRTPKAGGRLLDGRTWDEMPKPRAEVLMP